MGQLATLMRAELGQAPAQSAIFEAEGLTSPEGAVWPFVRDEAAASGVDPAIVMAIIGHESNFKIRAQNPYEKTGGPSTGLMQVQLPTARAALRNPGLTIEQLYDPLTNIRAGTRYLADQLRTYRGSVPYALAGYNAGSAIPVAGGGFVNQGYVDDVVRRIPRYQAIIAGLAPASSWAMPAGGLELGPWLLVGGLGAAGLAVALMARRRRR